MASLQPLENVDPYEITGVAREAAATLDAESFMSQLFPTVTTPAITFGYDEGGVEDYDLAEWRSFDGSPSFGTNQSEGARVTGALMPISRQYILSEEDQLNLRNLDNQAIAAKIEQQAARGGKAVALTIDQARVSALLTGTVTVGGSGDLPAKVVDFGRNVNRTVSPGIAWSDTVNAVPLEDIEAWQTILRDDVNAAGESTVAITSTSVLRNLQSNAQMRAYWAANGTTPFQLSADQVNTTLDREYGLSIVVTKERRRINGTLTYTLPQDHFIMVPGIAPLGTAIMGLTLESERIPDAQGIEAAGIVASAWYSQVPVQRYTTVDAICMVTNPNPDDVVVADVQ